MKRLDQVHTEMDNVHIKVLSLSDKREVNVAPLLFVVETSRIPEIEELSMDKYGNRITSDQDPSSENLGLSTLKWEEMCLQSMGQYMENFSMFGADLCENEQASKYRKASVEFPPEI